MEWSQRFLLIAAALGIGMATTAAVVGPKPTNLNISGRWVTPAMDSVDIYLVWRPVKDAKNNPVTYPWTLRTGENATLIDVASGTTADTVITRRYAAPPGDTTLYSGCVRALDVKGATSPQVCSGHLKVARPWIPPQPPVIIKIDTVAYDPSLNDTITLFLNGASIGMGASGGLMQKGDTAMICTLVWSNGYGTIPLKPVVSIPGITPRDSINIWNTQPASLLFEPRDRGCVKATALAQTVLRIGRRPRYWLAAP